MDSIRNYNNTKCDLKMARHRLNALMIEKEHIYTKYFPVTAKLTDMPRTTSTERDKMALYISEINKVNKITGMSLEQEIEHIRNLVGELEYYIKLMENCFKKYDSIEGHLYRLIVEKGMNKTKAVEKTAEKYNKEPLTICKYHYPNIANEIKKIQKA